ncbi:hypothetical protein BFP72_00885 [Reichenbachiella sp. 5M10]|nr:hypothetical protein BFP72_00885 [Reichenbachiella sp. 5M10]
MQEALLRMGLNDEATVLAPYALGWGSAGASTTIRPYEDLRIVIKPTEFNPTMEDFVQENEVNNYQTTASGIIYTVDGAGTGDLPEAGQSVTVQYEGYLLDSTKFDSSIDRGTPFTFVIGQEQVIAGWDEGIALYKKGQKGTLYIPYELGYGTAGSGSIAPYDDLIFEIEVIDIR